MRVLIRFEIAFRPIDFLCQALDRLGELHVPVVTATSVLNRYKSVTSDRE